MKIERRFSSEVCRRFSGLAANENGVVAVIFAVLLPAIIGFIALGIDVSSWYLSRNDLQTAADAAALSAAISLSNGNGATASAAATAAAQDNGFSQTAGQVLTYNSPPLSGPYAGSPSHVETVITAPAALRFAAIFIDAPTISVRSVASVLNGLDEFCMLGLDTISFSGNVDADLVCGIASNNSSASAITANGNIDVTTDILYSAGGIQDGGAIIAAERVTYAPPIVDPYASLTVPSYSGCDFNNLSINSNTTLSPGVYCGGISVTGTVQVDFLPGVYIIDGGDLSTAGKAHLDGTGVSIVLTSSSGTDYGNLSMTGSSEIEFTPPTSGAMQDVMIYQDRNAPSSGFNQITGNSELEGSGAIYFPSRELRFSGSAELEDGCIQIIAQQINVSGTFEIETECPTEPNKPLGRSRVRLYE